MPHTPGPWTAEHEDGLRWIVVAGGLALVVQFHYLDRGGEIPDNAETEANARLIAAAPDVLDALYALAVAVVASPTSVGEDLAVKSALDRAMVVTAAAEGRRLNVTNEQA